MYDTPLVSVVMSVYNGKPYLSEAVESILNQTFRNLELIVIDDGSTDGSASILESYQKRDSRLRVNHQENKGLVEALNRGCSLAQGRYIARMDADDIAIPERLLWQLEYMEQHPEVGILGGAIEYIDLQGRVFGTLHHPLEDHEIRTALFHAEASFCHPATIMRKEVVACTGGYRTRFLDAEDYDLWLRLARTSKLANLDRVVLKYRVHPGQVSQKKIVQQGLSILGAQETALAGDAAAWDELRSGSVITPGVLASKGVSKVKQQQLLILRYRNWISTLALAGDISGALRLANDMFRYSRWEHVDRALLAHMWLITATLYRRQNQVFRSLLAVSRAVILWPSVAGRPLKPFMSKLSRRFA